MLPQKLFRWMHRIALAAMLFASLAPSVSHALAAQAGTAGFMQEICGTGGKKLFIQVVTTQGKQIQTGLDIRTDQSSSSIVQHIAHCPFCHAGVADMVIPQHNPAFVLYLETLAKAQTTDYLPPLPSNNIHTAPLTRAPPVLL